MLFSCQHSGEDDHLYSEISSYYGRAKLSGCTCKDITEEKAVALDQNKSSLIDSFKVAKILKNRNVDIKIIIEATGLNEETVKEF